MTKTQYLRLILFCLIFVGIDQLSKSLAIQHLTYQIYEPILGNAFGFLLLYNPGIAFSLLSGFQHILPFFILVMTILFGIATFFVNPQPKFNLCRLSMLMVFSGAIGNLLDRVFRGDALFQGKVIDFIYIRLINFPVFNVADCYITVGVIFLFLFGILSKDVEHLFILPDFLQKKIKQDKEGK